MKAIRLVSLMILLAAGCGEVVLPATGAAPGDSEEEVDPPAQPCTDATCTCTDDEDCGAKALCDHAQDACVCISGYVPAGAAGCTWGGGLADPSFQDGTAWEASGGASVSPLATGDVAPGEAFFGADAVCSLGQLRQRVDMPPYAQADPFVATVNYRSMGNPNDLVGVAIRLGGAWLELPGRARWSIARLCLGESAYGGPIDVQVAPARVAADCGAAQPAANMAVDHLAITPAAPGECPAPGTVRNGDFEDGEGWSGTGQGDGTATIAAGAGAGGSRAAHLSTRTECSSAALTGQVSWPTASTLPSPALELWWRGSTGRALEMALGDRPVARLEGAGEERTSRICVPPWAQGLATAMTWSLPERKGACSRADERDFSLDDMRVVSEPGCGTDPHLLDGGFEAAAQGLDSGWQLSVPEGRGEASLVAAAGLAHSGKGAAWLAMYQDCGAAAVETFAVVPRPDDGRGPALTFWYRAGENPETELFATTGQGSDHGPLREDDDWRQETVCISPVLAGRTLRIGVRLDAGTGACLDEFPMEEAMLDDMAMTTTPDCPAA